ncbi:RNA-directed DNA polymerase, eukaryota, Reverse transcriptase zinc-binding domain protein [Artemisia annua]|uniref:RNA-directed DNA polymerase, eukaryota, Reverse transcriptase zinc-binding domain protein n=1 Tax=Artemisia annua TaxID=35608 RepID=A0A2U1MPI8_ARTAN|nr:RNA-directed DNA polymerase, eukaryota, Reverse transcriptase zinc-binding domain protein [Artemisia annua]
MVGSLSPLNRLPTRANLTCRGVTIPSSVCLFCGLDEESQLHCFLSCSIIKIIWRKLWSWWRSPLLYNPSLVDILKEKSGFIENKSVENLFHAVCMTFMWHVWKWRNKILHASSDAEAIAIRHEDFPSAQRLSLLWAYNRSSKKVIVSWKNWILNPGELASSSSPWFFLVLGVLYFGVSLSGALS